MLKLILEIILKILSFFGGGQTGTATNLKVKSKIEEIKKLDEKIAPLLRDFSLDYKDHVDYKKLIDERKALYDKSLEEAESLSNAALLAKLKGSAQMWPRIDDRASTIIDDSVVVARTDLESMYAKLSLAKYDDSLLQDCGRSVRGLWDLLSKRDSLVVLQQRQIELYRSITDDLKKLSSKKRSWYNNPAVGFIVGVATIYLASEIVENVK